MGIKLVRTMRKPPWPEVWSGMVSIAITLAILLTLVPIEVGVNDGVLSISLRQASANPDWLTGYDYRKQVAINGSTAGAQTQYQLLLNVHQGVGVDSGNDVYIGEQVSFPNDVRFTESDGATELPYWIEDITGYSSDGGAEQTPLCTPRAIYHGGKTYVVYQSQDLDPYITYYNHSTKAWATPVLVGDNNNLTGDSHGTPALLIDSSDYLHVFYGCHNTYVQYAKSTNPEDISAWTDMGDLGTDDMSYPQALLASDGSIYLFYRKRASSTDYPACYIVSTDGGANWGSENKIIDFSAIANRVMRGSVELEVGTPEKIHITWEYTDGTDTFRRNVYHTYMEITGANAGHLFSMNGTDSGTTITKAEADSYCLVVDSGTDNIGMSVVHLLGSIPYVIYTRDSTSLQGANFTYYITQWNGSSWDAPVAIGSLVGNDEFAGYDYVIHSADDIELYAVARNTAFTRGGDVEQWVYDGDNWTKQRTILTASGYALDFVEIPQNYNDGLKIIFGQRSSSYTVSLQEFAWGDDGLLGSTAHIWVNFDSIPASPDSGTFYIYYGKTEASSGSSIVDTFIKADDFEWGDDGDPLTDSGGGITWLVSAAGSSSVTIDTSQQWGGNRSADLYRDGTNNAVAYFMQAAGTDYSIRTRAMKGDTAACYIQQGNGSKRIYVRLYKDEKIQYYDTGFRDTGSSVPIDAWFLLEINNINWTAGTFDIYLNDVCIQSDAVMQSTSSTNGAIGFTVGDGTVHAWLDNAILRKWCDPEPTWGDWGAEEGFNPEISNTPDNYGFGVLQIGTSSNTSINYFSINNTGNCAVDITIQGTNFTAGDDTWELSADASVGENICGMMAGLDDDDDLFDVVVNITANAFVANLAEAVTQAWGLNFSMPDSLSGFDGNVLTGTITLIASEHTG